MAPGEEEDREIVHVTCALHVVCVRACMFVYVCCVWKCARRVCVSCMCARVYLCVCAHVCMQGVFANVSVCGVRASGTARTHRTPCVSFVKGSLGLVSFAFTPARTNDFSSCLVDVVGVVNITTPTEPPPGLVGRLKRWPAGCPAMAILHRSLQTETNTNNIHTSTASQPHALHQCPGTIRRLR